MHDVYSTGGSNTAVVLSYSGLYNYLYAAGYRSCFQIYHTSLSLQLFSVLFILIGRIHVYNIEDLFAWSGGLGSRSHEWRIRLYNICFDSSGLRLNYHLGALFGLSSICWSGHLVHVSVPFSRGLDYSLTTLPDPLGLYPMFVGHWAHYTHTCLSFIGGVKSDTASLFMTDIAHHHLSLGVLLIWSCHVYSSISTGFGHRIRDIAFGNGSGSGVSLILASIHLQLSLALIGLSVITSVVAQHTYSLRPYPFLSYDYVTFTALFVHHLWISSILMMGGFAHASIFLVRDYSAATYTSTTDLILRLILNKASIISHLSWVCLFLGFHTLGLYIHNDSVVAFGEPEKQILIEPVFAQVLQCSSGKTLYGLEYVQSVSTTFDSIFLPISSGDLIAHHAIALGLHVTSLICIKGSLDARGSRIMPDKLSYGFGFSCDGPGRGGTCDISAWDAFYLAFFWMLNSSSWILYYFHWKHLTLDTNAAVFNESSSYLNGWFRDYLWFNSSSLIRGYDCLGANDISLWAWLFLAAHLCWATGFMFLISWRGYWQELVDIILFMHLRCPLLYDLWTGGYYTPIALSIVQARFIGLVHFSVGLILTYAPFVISSSS
uniref:photosystem I n=1 Tax=Pyrocystis lunula TaxID=2972 RepID=A0A2R4QHC2_PYRLU|nr:photosystem I apoprotein A2 [Pyrocystis lunula]